MKIGVIILCRYDSTRLYGKALIKIHKKPILEWISLSIANCLNIDKICIATSDEKSDDKIAEFCEKQNINCYRGSKLNVAKRFLNCAKQFDLDYTFRINGDNLFVDSALISQMAEIASEQSFDFISNVEGRTFPIGMSVELLKVSFFEEIYKKYNDERHFEHVTLYLYENPKVGNRKSIINNKWEYLKGIHLAVDTIQDFNKAESIFQHANGDYHKISYSFLNEMAREGRLS
jgi:spore coat polysaccharide biosynthesis protein SpsF